MSATNPFNLQPLQKNHRVYLKVSLTLTLIMLAGVLMVFSRLQPQIPLFYSLALPEQALANKEWLFSIPIFSLVINLIHWLVFYQLSKDATNQVVWRLFWSVTIFIQMLLAIALLRIVWVVS